LTLPAAIVAVVAAICVPPTTSAGGWLEHHVASTALLHTHTALGDTLLPWAVALDVAAVVLVVMAVVVAVGSVITVYEIGDVGARAVWTGKPTAHPWAMALGALARH
jgi:hypothetical protein